MIWLRRMLGLGLGLLLLASLSVLGFRIAMDMAPEYSDRVAEQVGRMLQAEVTLRRLALGWEGWAPAVELVDLQLIPLGGDPATPVGDGLHIQSLRVGLDLLALARGELVPRQLAVEGIALVIEQRDGQWVLPAWPQPQSSSAPRGGLRDVLEPFSRLRAADVRLTVQAADAATPVGEWLVQTAQLRRRGEQHSLSVRAAGPDSAQVELQVQLQNWQPQRVSGAIQRLDLQPWQSLDARLSDWPALMLHRVQGQLDRHDDGGPVANWHYALEVDAALRTTIPPQAAESPPLGAEQAVATALLATAEPTATEAPAAGLSAPVSPQPVAEMRATGALRGQISDQSIRVESSALRVLTADDRWPEQAVFVEYQSANPVQLRVQAEWLDLGAVWPHLQGSGADVPLNDLDGVITDITVSWSGGDRWPAAVGQFNGLTIQAQDPAIRIAGLDGEFSSDGPRGRVVINAEQVAADWTELFSDTTVFDTLSGTVDWARGSQGLQWELPDLAFAVSGVDGVGRIARQADGSWYADSRFLAPDLRTVRTQIPVFWHPNLRRWLADAVRTGELREGRVQLEGRPGEAVQSQLELQLGEVDFLFANGWDALQAQSGVLRIQGQDLSVEIPSARLRGVEVTGVRADMRLVPEALLKVRAQVDGDGAEMLQILGDSPLGPQLAATRRALSLRGRVQAALDLDIDLHGLDRTRWEVDAELRNTRLSLSGWPSPLQNLSGRLRLSAAGLAGDGLRATMNGWPVQMTATRRVGRTTVRAIARPELSRLPRSWPLPGWLRTRLGGRPEVIVEAMFGGDRETEIVVRSDLIGGSVALPQPLATSEDLARRIWFRVRPESQGLDLSYGQLLGIHAENLGGADQRLALRLGSDSAPTSPVAGLWVDGKLESADLDAWVALLQDIVGEAESSKQPDQIFGGVNLRISALHWGSQTWADTDLQVLRSGPSWLANLRGDTLNGQLLVNRRDDTQLALAGQFDRLDWVLTDPRPGDPAELPPWQPPSRLPALDVRVARFRLNGEDLGALTLGVTPNADGYTLDTLRIGSDSAAAAVSLQGRVRSPLPAETGVSPPAGSLSFSARTAGSGAWLRALGYADWLQASAIDATGELSWQQPEDLAALRVSGDVDLRVDSGRLLSVNPGAGRFLGLLSVTSLPRRFLLDFSDMTDAGLGFDVLEGRYTLREGLATTESLKISGPSVRIEAKGTVDLVRREQDQVVTIMPGISHGFTAAATVLGGPAMGLFLLFAQELLDKPLDQVGQISYRLTGPLDNPVVEPRP